MPLHTHLGMVTTRSGDKGFIWNFIYLLVEVKKSAANLENNLAVKYGVTQEPRNFTPTYISKRKENTCPHKILYMNVCPTELEMAQRSFDNG